MLLTLQKFEFVTVLLRGDRASISKKKLQIIESDIGFHENSTLDGFYEQQTETKGAFRHSDNSIRSQDCQKNEAIFRKRHTGQFRSKDICYSLFRNKTFMLNEIT